MVDVILNLGRWIGIFIGLVALTKLVEWAGRRIFGVDWPERAARRLRELWGGGGVAVRKPQPSEVMPTNFVEQGLGKIDYAIYELSLRENLPLMDLLYFEYLRGRLEKGTIKEVLIFPWAGGLEGDADILRREELLRERLKGLFGTLQSRVRVVGVMDLEQHGGRLLEPQFFANIARLGRPEFLAERSRELGVRFRQLSDINRGHPLDHQARSLIEHPIRGWLIFHYVREKILDKMDSDEVAKIVFASLFWERELTKVFVLINLQDLKVRTSLLLGKTVGFRALRFLNRDGTSRFSRGITTFNNNALMLYDAPSVLVRKCSATESRQRRVGRTKQRSRSVISNAEARQLNRVINEIHQARGGMGTYSEAPDVDCSDLSKAKENLVRNVVRLQRNYDIPESDLIA